jgi:hypothetical protein
MIEKPAKYLDKILKILSEDFNKYHTVQQIKNKLEPVSIFGQTGDVIFSEDLLLDLRKALHYLNSQNLIERDLHNGSFKLSFEGYIKIKTNSFSKEIKTKSINQTLQRLAWIVSIIISSLALLISIFKSSSSLDCCNSKIDNSKIECKASR